MMKAVVYENIRRGFYYCQGGSLKVTTPGVTMSDGGGGSPKMTMGGHLP